MRTTVTLDPDTRLLIEKRMAERGVSFKQALNDAIRAGLVGSDDARPKFRTKTASMGKPRVDLTKALQLAAELDDARTLRVMHGDV